MRRVVYLNITKDESNPIKFIVDDLREHPNFRRIFDTWTDNGTYSQAPTFPRSDNIRQRPHGHGRGLGNRCNYAPYKQSMGT